MLLLTLTHPEESSINSDCLEISENNVSRSIEMDISDFSRAAVKKFAS